MNADQGSEMSDRRPHSRACGIIPHDHGWMCHANCPTCHGKELPAPQMVCFDPDDPGIKERLVLEAHRAICEDSYEDCIEWGGRCVKSFEAMLSALKASE